MEIIERYPKKAWDWKNISKDLYREKNQFTSKLEEFKKRLAKEFYWKWVERAHRKDGYYHNKDYKQLIHMMNSLF